MYITSDYMYTIGMCTLLVYTYMVSNMSTTERKSTTCTPLVYVHCCEQNVCTGGLVIHYTTSGYMYTIGYEY